MKPLSPFESSIAEHYHEETKYTERRLRESVGKHPPPDFGDQPVPFRSLSGPRILLPAEGLPIQRTGKPAAASVRVDGPGRWDLVRLAHLLWHTNGCTRVFDHGGAVQHFRAAPSAGAMYPTEVYVAVRDLPGAPEGVYNYQIPDHSLVAVNEGPWKADLEAATFEHPAVAVAQVVVILTGVFRRSSWRYRERGYRRVLLDTGHVLGNAVEWAPVEGFAARPISTFQDGACERLLGLDGAREGVLAVVAMIPASAAEHCPSSPVRVSRLTEWHDALDAVGDRVPERTPEAVIAALHLAGSIGPDAEPVEEGTPPAPLPPEGGIAIPTSPAADPWAAGTGTVADTIARRRSTRHFVPLPVKRSAFFGSLAHAVPKDLSFLFAPELLRTYVVSLNVVGVPPGTYLFEHDTLRLVELSRGQVADEMLHLGLGQQIFVHAAAAVVHTADLTRAVARHGDRAYRLLHLDAGHIGERLNLALLAQGVGVSGCAGFYDDEMNRVLQIPESQAVIYITSLGTPTRPRSFG